MLDVAIGVAMVTLLLKVFAASKAGQVIDKANSVQQEVIGNNLDAMLFNSDNEHQSTYSTSIADDSGNTAATSLSESTGADRGAG